MVFMVYLTYDSVLLIERASNKCNVLQNYGNSQEIDLSLNKNK